VFRQNLAAKIYTAPTRRATKYNRSVATLPDGIAPGGKLQTAGLETGWALLVVGGPHRRSIRNISSACCVRLCRETFAAVNTVARSRGMDRRQRLRKVVDVIWVFGGAVYHSATIRPPWSEQHMYQRKGA